MSEKVIKPQKISSAYWPINNTSYVDNSTSRYDYIEYKPSEIDVNNNNINFVINASDAYKIISDSFLDMEVQITNSTGTDYTDKFFHVSNPIPIFSNYRLSMNNSELENKIDHTDAWEMYNQVFCGKNCNKSSFGWYYDKQNSAPITSTITGVVAGGNVSFSNLINTLEILEPVVQREKNMDSRTTNPASATGRYSIPLSELFGLCKTRFCVSGQSIELNLTRSNRLNTVIYSGLDNVTADLKILKLTLRVPYVKPELSVLSEIMDVKNVVIPYQPFSFFRSNLFSGTVSSDSYLVSTQFKQVNSIIIGFKRKVNYDKHMFLKGIYEDLKLKRLHVRLNGQQFPLLSLVAPNTGNYLQFYNSLCINDTTMSSPNTCDLLINYNNYTNHLLSYIDLSKQDNAVFSGSSSAQIEIVFERDATGSASPADDFYIFACVIQDKQIMLDLTTNNNITVQTVV